MLMFYWKVLTKNRTCSGPKEILSIVFLGIYEFQCFYLKMYFGPDAFLSLIEQYVRPFWTNIIWELMDSLILRWCNFNRTIFLLSDDSLLRPLFTNRNPEGGYFDSGIFKMICKQNSVQSEWHHNGHGTICSKNRIAVVSLTVSFFA